MPKNPYRTDKKLASSTEEGNRPLSHNQIFENEKTARISSLRNRNDLSEKSVEWITDTADNKYAYNFEWLGRPIIQFPQDIVAIQEVIWNVKPDLIIETGIAHGGSLILSASMLSMLDLCELQEGMSLNISSPNRMVLGIDIDIRDHNRTAIEEHPMSHRIKMIQGSSIDPEIINQVHNFAGNFQRIMVILDSNHTHDHVLKELTAYAPLTSLGSYCVVFDTIIEDLPSDMFPDRPWGKGNNPKTAVWEYLKNNGIFEIDRNIESKLLITVAPDGYLKKIK